MTTRRILLAAFAVAPMLFGTAAGAAEMTYTPAAFEAAQKAGKPILVHITRPVVHHLRRPEADPVEA